jgi:uncharacterized membrane protein
MKCKTCVTALTIVSFAGLLFSGYLSGIKFFSDTCAFGESCPYFLGYPACYYGFVMYVLLFLTSILTLVGKFNEHIGAKLVLSVASLGVLFAGYFTFRELPKLFSDGLTAYVLGLPTCALGLIFYILIWVIAFRIMRKTAA